jgi:hypothetical protein
MKTSPREKSLYLMAAICLVFSLYLLWQVSEKHGNEFADFNRAEASVSHISTYAGEGYFPGKGPIPMYKHKATYEYFVKGKRYSGTPIDNHRRMSKNTQRRTSENIEPLFPIGIRLNEQPAHVYYDPSFPERFVLSKRSVDREKKVFLFVAFVCSSIFIEKGSVL